MHNMPIGLGVIGKINKSVYSSDIRVLSNFLLHLNKETLKDTSVNPKGQATIKNLF